MQKGQMDTGYKDPKAVSISSVGLFENIPLSPNPTQLSSMNQWIDGQ